ncbi:MAG: hypothetical protein KC731_29225, partial [Myxococcales bacterium]|nr:hypothetical protein [Myxococcales bacterium]
DDDEAEASKPSVVPRPLTLEELSKRPFAASTIATILVPAVTVIYLLMGINSGVAELQTWREDHRKYHDGAVVKTSPTGSANEDAAERYALLPLPPTTDTPSMNPAALPSGTRYSVVPLFQNTKVAAQWSDVFKTGDVAFTDDQQAEEPPRPAPTSSASTK